MKTSPMKPITITVLILLVFSGCGGGGGGGSSDGTGYTIQLEWIPPVTRMDGVYLAPGSIAGYRVYVGPDPDDMNLTVDLADSTMTEYAYSAPAAEQYYFGVTAYDTSGRESGMSNIVYK